MTKNCMKITAVVWNQISNIDMVLVGFAFQEYYLLWRGYYDFHAPWSLSGSFLLLLWSCNGLRGYTDFTARTLHHILQFYNPSLRIIHACVSFYLFAMTWQILYFILKHIFKKMECCFVLQFNNEWRLNMLMLKC